MSSPAFRRALSATGYLGLDGTAAPNLYSAASEEAPVRLHRFLAQKNNGVDADAVFAAHGTTVSIFKDLGHRNVGEDELGTLHQAAWNVGLAPLLWVVTPTRVIVYNCYEEGTAGKLRENSFVEAVDLDDEASLGRLDRQIGRFATETGAFWQSAIGKQIDRRNRVDKQLLSEIKALENRLLLHTVRGLGFGTARGSDPLRDLLEEDRVRILAFVQKLIARTMFAWYVCDRKLATDRLPNVLADGLPLALGSAKSTVALFDWLTRTYNGDLFPKGDLERSKIELDDDHAKLLASFARSEEVASGQGRLFEFKFDSISIDLVSSVYQQFARSVAGEASKKQSLHYTPIELADFVLDPVFEGLPKGARVLDPTCGSGIFLVEAFRRLVWKACGDGPYPRSVVRRILYEDIRGLDINPAALRVAAFSLYLAALELEDEEVGVSASGETNDLVFDGLIGLTLHEVDTLSLPATQLTLSLGRFDAVVGNPPWTYAGAKAAEPGDGAGGDRDGDGVDGVDEEGIEALTGSAVGKRPRRSPDHAFANKAVDLLAEGGRVGLIMKATPFFSRDGKSVASAENLLERLAPAALVNLSPLRKEDLFPHATGAALVLFGRCPLSLGSDRILVGTVPWTSLFRRTGMLAIGPSDFQALPMATYRRHPGLLKAAAMGSLRDVALMAQLEGRYPTLSEVCDKTDVRHGQGVIVGKDPAAAWEDRRRTAIREGREPEPMDDGIRRLVERRKAPDWLADLPYLETDDYEPVVINRKRLRPYPHDYVERSRIRDIFEGPLLICPKGQFSKAERGRYSAASVEGPLAFSQNFYGLSFRGRDGQLERDVLCGLLNSSMAPYQLALSGGAVGVERPAVSPQDVLAIRIPRLGRQDPKLLRLVARRVAQLRSPIRDDGALAALDEAVFDLYDLDPEERNLVLDGVRRHRWMFVDLREELETLTRIPNEGDMRAYASAVVRSIDAFLAAAGKRHFEGIVNVAREEGFASVTFTMRDGGPLPEPAVVSSERRGGDHEEPFASLMTGGHLPYLNERRAIRFYKGDVLTVLKPAEWRYWTVAAGLNDADAILADHRSRR